MECDKAIVGSGLFRGSQAIQSRLWQEARRVWGALEVFGRSCGVSKDIWDLCEGHNRSGRFSTRSGGLCQHLGSINEWQSDKVTQIELDKR